MPNKMQVSTVRVNCLCSSCSRGMMDDERPLHRDQCRGKLTDVATGYCHHLDRSLTHCYRFSRNQTHTRVQEHQSRKEGNVLFNHTLSTFYLWLYGVRHMVNDSSESERKPTAAATTWTNLVLISSKGSFVCTLQQT